MMPSRDEGTGASIEPRNNHDQASGLAVSITRRLQSVAQWWVRLNYASHTEIRILPGLVPRTNKDLIEEQLFAKRRSLFNDVGLAIFDTTSLYFEGEGGPTLGRNGHSKDSRPDLHQRVLGVVIDETGRPICSEMWPGNTADVTTLIPVVTRLRERFQLNRLCVIADRGMVSAKTIATLEAHKIEYILGVRQKCSIEVAAVLADKTPFVSLTVPKANGCGTLDLQVKEVVRKVKAGQGNTRRCRYIV